MSNNDSPPLQRESANEESAEWVDEASNLREDDFHDYLKVQKACRDRRRLAASTHNFMLQQASFYNHGNGRTARRGTVATRRNTGLLTGVVVEEDSSPLPTKSEHTHGINSDHAPVATNSSHAPPPSSSHSKGKKNARRKTMNALQVLGMRPGVDDEEWQQFLDAPSEHSGLDSVHEGSGNEEDDEESFHNEKESHHHHPQQDGGGGHDNHHHHSHHQLMLPWYCSPVQRQLWDDDQVLPHVNWHDLFFDLIFVAAAYNLGGMLISAMNKDDWPRGVVYFIGIFGPLYLIWENDVIYASRYTLVDYSHRIVAVLRFLCVSFAVLSIKPLELLGDKHSAETFVFCLSLFLESLVQLGLNLELYLHGDGDRKAIQNQTKRETACHVLPTSVTYLIATIIAGRSFFHPEESTHYGGYGEHEDGYGSSYEKETGGYNAYNSTGHADSHGDSYDAAASSDKEYRFLAEADYDSSHGSYGSEGVQWSIADVPLFLCLGIYVFNLLLALFQKSTHSKKIRDIREHFVPNNIDYMIHRYGEWIMLMIGESILSLLIVETVEAQRYYLITGLGCLTVIVLQMLKFESQPAHADGHALWRSMTAATLYSILLQVLSMSLVAFGVSYKLMLKAVVKEEASSGSYDDHRRLAGSYYVSSEANTWLFCISLAVILVTLEMIMGTHRGFAEIFNDFFRTNPEEPQLRLLNWPVIIITVIKVGIVAVTATLGLWDTDIFHVAIAGFIIVTAMAFIRIVGWGYTHHEEYINTAINDVGKSVQAFVLQQGVSLQEEMDAATSVSDSMNAMEKNSHKTSAADTTSANAGPFQSPEQPLHPSHKPKPSAEKWQTIKPEPKEDQAVWKAATDKSGATFYYEEKTGTTTYTKPSGSNSAPSSTPNKEKDKVVWKSATDNFGTTFYYEVGTGRTTYTDPTQSAPPPSSPPDTQLWV